MGPRPATESVSLHGLPTDVYRSYRNSLRAQADPPETISQVVTLVSHGCPIAAIEAAFALDRRTVRRWGTEAGQHAERIHHHHVLHPRATQHVQADEVRVTRQGSRVWMAMAVVDPTHLWFARHSNTANFCGIHHKRRFLSNSYSRAMLIPMEAFSST